MANLVIMEDEPDILLLVETTLNFGGHTVRSAGHGYEGIELVRQQPPDLVLLDVQMPDISGYDVLRILKSDSTLGQVPVLLFSANNRPEDIRKGKELGASGFLCKPFDPKNLLEQVNQTLESMESSSTKSMLPR